MSRLLAAEDFLKKQGIVEKDSSTKRGLVDRQNAQAMLMTLWTDPDQDLNNCRDRLTDYQKKLEDLEKTTEKEYDKLIEGMPSLLRHLESKGFKRKQSDPTPPPRRSNRGLSANK